MKRDVSSETQGCCVSHLQAAPLDIIVYVDSAPGTGQYTACTAPFSDPISTISTGDRQVVSKAWTLYLSQGCLHRGRSGRILSALR